MKGIKSNKRYLWNFYVFPLVCAAATCYPLGKLDIDAQPEVRDEKHFPNGTVIGKYTYMDNEGNPIQVKYYADDASYGVELKSIKVVDSTGEQLPAQQSPNKGKVESQEPSALSAKSNSASNPTLQRIQSNIQNVQNSAQILQSVHADKFNPAKPIEGDLKSAGDILGNNINSNVPGAAGYKYNKNDPYDFLNKEVGSVSKVNRYKIEKPASDYEIYYQNELKGPKKCGKEKVRVYFDQENRQIRSVDSINAADKFCEQF